MIFDLDWHSFEELPSTNDTALELARDGAPTGTAVSARKQTAGRGRRGRSWFSPIGSLALSIVHRPTRPLDEVASLTPCVAVSLARTLRGLGLEPRLKWPNDVLLDGRKVAGILCELHDLGSAGPVVIIGVGINVNVTEFPEELAELATSIQIASGGGQRKLDAVADRVVGDIRVALASHDRGEGVPAEFTELLVGIGSRVTVTSGPQQLTGTLAGVRSRDGALRVVDDDGIEHAITSGEVSLSGWDD